MSHYTTPFLLYNIGPEMVYVVAQRLEAQNISPERSSLVLDEIISVLISNDLIVEVMKPQAIWGESEIRTTIEEIAQSSAMRLDPTSMNKLWDLITMVFKWQIVSTNDLIRLTLRHLYEIETYVKNEETHLQLHKIQDIVANFDKLLCDDEKTALYSDVYDWLHKYNVRVSLLMRMGLQNQDASFNRQNLDPLAENMLRNVGENIYAATQNGRVLMNNANTVEIDELKTFVDQMIGDRANREKRASSLRLSINRDDGKTDTQLQNVAVEVDNKKDILDELACAEDEVNCNFKQDLLDMLDENLTLNE